MQHVFGDFLRNGGNGEYDFIRRDGHIIGRRSGLSLKSTFPNYSALRADFGERLDQVISENTRMLLNALTPPDTVPTVTEAGLRDVSDAKAEALDAWDVRLESIFSEYENHQQRLRPLRAAMEERLVRAFAGLINQIRQEDLGIVQYIWRSRDDTKVRDSHAAYDDRVFRWGNPPEGGHPGEAHNCRCYAEPVLPGVQSNVVLADFAPTAGSVPALDLTDAIRGLRALTGVGAALLASDALQDWTDAMREWRVDEAGGRLGVDVTTVEGRLAATAYALAQEGISSGGYPVLPKDPEFARIGAEAAALYELLNPGTILETGVGGDSARQRALQDFIEAAGEAFARDNLQLQPGELAQGWVEIFPELTKDERRLGELSGFTPERIEQWLETYPIEELGLPNNTGSPVPGDPTSNIISTPIPEATGPNIVANEIGNLSIPDERDLPDDFGRRSIELASENGVQRPREGRAGARYEAATGTVLTRPDPADPAYDFFDESNRERIEVKGPVPGVDGAVPEERLDGLIEATIEEANFQSGADRIVVDAEGLSATQVDRLRQELENRVSSDIPVDIMR
ncbi:phage minor head protein [Tateyamaria sp. SN3-11]|uniref:phage minor head protein n=1 Tax=Tateyamaria sp. SN3-11 TaxID=3092147 RepID=UPI0039E7E331